MLQVAHAKPNNIHLGNPGAVVCGGLYPLWVMTINYKQDLQFLLDGERL